MTKDQIIADLREMNAWLRSRVDTLEAARPLTSTERSQRLRQRKRDENATKMQRNVVATPVESTSPSSSSEDGTNVPLDPKKVGNSNSEHATKMQRQNVAFDREHAESDAASRNLFGPDFEAELRRFTDYWDSAGWKRKSGPIRDRNATFRSWLDSPYRVGKANGNGHDRSKGQSAIDEWAQRHAEADVIEGEVMR